MRNNNSSSTPARHSHWLIRLVRSFLVRSARRNLKNAIESLERAERYMDCTGTDYDFSDEIEAVERLVDDCDEIISP